MATMRQATTRLLLASATALLAGCPGLDTASPGAPGGLEGTVRLEVVGAKAGVQVSLAGPEGEQRAETDATGTYRFAGLKPGIHTLTASYPRYFSQSATFSAEAAAGRGPALTIANHEVLWADPGLIERTNLVLAPDLEHLAFLQGSAVMLLPRAGGSPEKLCDLPLESDEHVRWFDLSGSGRLLYTRERAGTNELCAHEPGAARPPALIQDAYPLTSPVWSPDGTRLAYLRDRTLATDASGYGHVDLFVAASDGTSPQLLEDRPINPIYKGIEPMEWGPWGLLYHRAMTCNTVTDRTDDAGAPIPMDQAGDGIYYFRDTAQGPTKIYYYSYEAHCWSADGKAIYLGIGGSVRRRALDYPGDYREGTEIVGYTRQADKRSFVLDPDGQTLYFIDPAGIERMNLLP